MPEKAGPFERKKVIQYDQAGRNLSAGYNAIVGGENPLPIVVTLYVYPAPPGDDLDAHFNSVVRDVGENHGGGRPEFRNNILLGPRQFVGRYAVFGYAEPWGGLKQDIPLRSYLVLYRWNGWWVKWRATTPAPVSPERMKAIVALTESLLPPESEPEESKEPPPSDPSAERLALRAEDASSRPPTSARPAAPRWDAPACPWTVSGICSKSSRRSPCPRRSCIDGEDASDGYPGLSQPATQPAPRAATAGRAPARSPRRAPPAPRPRPPTRPGSTRDRRASAAPRACDATA
jgi:hypothetical protein